MPPLSGTSLTNTRLLMKRLRDSTLMGSGLFSVRITATSGTEDEAIPASMQSSCWITCGIGWRPSPTGWKARRSWPTYWTPSFGHVGWRLFGDGFSVWELAIQTR